MSRPHPRVMKILTLSAAAGLVAALGAAMIFALQTDPREVRAMRTRGAILGVTSGDEPLILGARWQKWLLRLFPSLKERIGGTVLRPSKAGKKSLAVWQNWGPEARHISQTLTATIHGDRGERLRFSPDSLFSDYGAADGQFITATELTTYPRRGTQLHVRVVAGNYQATDSREFSVSNPAAGNYPVWSANSPQQRSGGLEVTLERLLTGVPGQQTATAERRPDTQLDLLIRENGKPATDRWAVERVTIADPTGNRWSHYGPFPVEGNGQAHIREWSLLLPVEEPAYRVRVDLARTQRYPPEDLWTISGLELPRPGQTLRPHRQRTLHGCTLELTTLLGAGVVSARGVSSSAATGELQVTGPTDRYCLRDLIGHSYFGHSPFDNFFSPKDEPYRIDLDHARSGGPFTLQFALTPRRTVEFLAHASAPTQAKH